MAISMDLKQLEYMIKIAEENNITRAAEKLFITQSALNQQLLKLEKELGTQLFVRSRTNWHPTPAGEIYLENAKKMVRIKKDTYNEINDLVEIKKGKLVIGLTPERGTEMFAAIYPAFYKKYHNVKVEPIELSVKQQQHEISMGNLDIGFLTLQDEQKTKDEYIHICREEIILAVPQTHYLAHLGGNLGSRLPEISLDHFRNEPFALMQTGSTLREIYDDLAAEEDFHPSILLETRSVHTLYNMVAEGLCCSIIPMYYARETSNVTYFTLKHKPTWEVCASYKKGTYLNNPAKDLINIGIDYWANK
jgi:DNA-binding transcriptional LysR family regulator